MSKREKIEKIFNDNGGIIKTSDVTGMGIHNVYLGQLMHEGKIERIKRGFYQWVEGSGTDKIKIIAALFPDGIICMDSALYYYGYTDRTPDRWHIAVDKNSNKSRFKITFPQIKPHYIEPKLLEIGLSSANINGTDIKIFDRERAICDVIKHSNKMDREIVNKAIQGYIKDSAKRIRMLIQYAKKLRIFKKVEIWIGLWL